MNGSSDNNKSVSSSSSSTPNKRFSISKGTDENCQSHQEMGLNAKIPTAKAAMATKHFMSPTISAASKANPPRKKILAERNESFDTHLQKTPTFDSKCTSGAEFGENALLDDDLSSKPYDPSTNYLSPRPKYLRYNPNRRRGIFIRSESEVKKGQDESFSSESDSSKSKRDNDGEEGESDASITAVGQQDNGVKQEGEATDDEEEDEFEEIEEERCWGSRGVLKFLLLLVVLLLSTSYISSMNSPTPSLVVQTVEGIKGGYHIVQDYLYDFVENLESRYHAVLERERLQRGFNYVDGIDEEEDMIAYEVVMEEEKYDDELDGSEALNILEVEEKSAVGEGSGGVWESEAKEIVEHEEKEAVANLGDVIKPQADESANAGDETEKVDPELQGTLTVEMSELLPMTDVVDSQVMVSSVLDGSENANEVASEPVKEEFVDSKIGRIEKAIDDYPDYPEILSDEAEENSKEGLKERMKTGSILAALVGMSILFSFVSVFAHFMRKRNAETQKDASTVVQPRFKPVIAEKCCSLLAKEKDKDIEINAQTQNDASAVVQPRFEPVIPEKCSSMLAKEEDEGIEHLVPSTNSANSIEEISQNTYHSRAPSVEFLGEIEVGEMTSTLRSCGKKTRMMESEVSSHSASMEKETHDKTRSVPVHLQPAFSETSAMDPPSYGGFTTEKRIAKKLKQEEADGETSKVVTTPVRRSSRIRNRSIASP